MGATCLYGHKEILVNSSMKAKKKNGQGHLKKSVEQSRAILVFLFHQKVWYYLKENQLFSFVHAM